MTDRPVEPDAHNSRDNQVSAAFHRPEAECGCCGSVTAALARNPALPAQLLPGPADSGFKVRYKLGSVIEAYAATRRARAPQTRNLVRCVFVDIARLTRRKDRKP